MKILQEQDIGIYQYLEPKKIAYLMNFLQGHILPL